MLYSDLQQVRSLFELDPDNTAEDRNLLFYVEWASRFIEEVINRPGLSKQERTEYYGGTNSPKLVLRHRPAYATPTPEVYLDEQAFFGSVDGAFTASTSRLTYGTDFCLALRDDSGKSYSGLLIRINGVWPRPHYRKTGLLAPYMGEGFGSIKVVYTAGYTVDDLPEVFRLACNLLIAKMRGLFSSAGIEVTGESYDDRSLSFMMDKRDYWHSLIRPMLQNYRNFRVG